MKEGAPQEEFESNEQPKKISAKQLESGVVSVSLSEELQEKMGANLLGHLAGIAHAVELAIATEGTKLFEVILHDGEDGGEKYIEVKSYPDPEIPVPDEVFDKINAQIDVLNPIF